MKTERSLCHLLRIVQKYEQGSGAKLNSAKSEAMWLGRWRANGASPFGLKWVKKLRILGVYFSNGLLDVDTDNWKPKLDKLKQVLGLWSKQDPSFLGRGMILNVLGASRFWHVAKILSPPSWICDEYKRIVWPFIWKGSKPEAVSRQRCSAPISKGGLNVVDFETKCASLHLSNFEFGTCKWHYLAHYFLGNRLVKFDDRFDFCSRLIPQSSEPSAFYRNCLSLFRTIHSKRGSLPDDLSCKRLYLLLFDCPCAPPRSAGFGGSVVSRPINRWASVWRKSRLKIIENKKNDLIWLILHRAIRVRYTLKTWRYIATDKCAVCSQVETIKHCFLFCPRVLKVWDHFSPRLSRLFDFRFSVSVSSVFFPLSDSQSSPALLLSCHLIASCIYYVWNARNLASFPNSVLSSQKIIDMIVKDVSLRIRCSSTDKIKHFWSLRNVVCSVDGANNVTFFP